MAVPRPKNYRQSPDRPQNGPTHPVLHYPPQPDQIPSLSTEFGSQPPLEDDTVSSFRSSRPSRSLSFCDQLGCALDTMSTSHRGYMWAVRPVLWLSFMAFWGFFASSMADLLRIIWWTSSTNIGRAGVAWLCYFITILIAGAVINCLATPRDDSLWICRLTISIPILVAVAVYAFLKGWLPSPVTLLDLWFVDGWRAFDWLPKYAIVCGVIWIALGFIAIMIKVCFWWHELSKSNI